MIGENNKTFRSCYARKLLTLVHAGGQYNRFFVTVWCHHAGAHTFSIELNVHQFEHLSMPANEMCHKCEVEM